MEPVDFRRHAIKYYLASVTLFIFFLGIGVFLLFAFHKLEPPVFENNTSLILLNVVGWVFIIFGFYSLWQYRKNVPSLTVTDQFLKVGKRLVNWAEVDSIELLGKQTFQYLPEVNMEGIKIIMTDAAKLYLFDDMYANPALLKQLLDWKVNGTVAVDDLSVAGDLGNTTEFSGNFFSSARGWLIIGMFAFFIVPGLIHPFHQFDILNAIVIPLFFLLFTIPMSYSFHVTEHTLIARNRLWRRDKSFALNNIREIVFEQATRKLPDGLRIITKDYRSNLFYACTLSNKTWKSLETFFKQHGVSVRAAR